MGFEDDILGGIWVSIKDVAPSLNTCHIWSRFRISDPLNSVANSVVADRIPNFEFKELIVGFFYEPLFIRFTDATSIFICVKCFLYN